MCTPDTTEVSGRSEGAILFDVTMTKVLISQGYEIFPQKGKSLFTPCCVHNYSELHVNLTCFILVALKVSLFYPLSNSHTVKYKHMEDILKC